MSTLIDLFEVSATGVECDICIIGAGAAGIFLANRLATSGLDVVLVEAGGRHCVAPEEAGFESRFPVAHYSGATVGRAIGVGGSTSRWGGLLVPHGPSDLRGTETVGRDPWRHIVDTVASQSDQVLAALGYGHRGDFETYAQLELGATGAALMASGLMPVASLFLPFRFKNLSFLLERAKDVRVIYNAVVTEWQVESGAGGARIRHVAAASPDGRKCTLRARRFVLAAGALESTRLLMDLREQTGVLSERRKSTLGQFLSDHLSVAIADVPAQAARAVIQAFAPRFVNGWMRSFRLLEAASAQAVPRSFSHFIFNVESAGFALAKKVLTSLQQRRMPRVSLGEALNGAGGILNLGAKRYFGRRLYVPENTPIRLQLDVEQLPREENGIYIGEGKDRHGRRIPHVCWGIGEGDMERIRETSARVLKGWSLSGLPALLPRQLDGAMSKPHDAYHPVGTCRMGTDEGAVVDENLKVLGLDNVWLASTAVFPTVGTANPTFSLLCLTNKLAEDLRI